MSVNLVPDGNGGAKLMPGQLRVQLTAAQLQTLTTKPVMILPAPGKGRMIVPILAMLIFTPGATLFTNSNANTALLYGNDPNASLTATSPFGFDGTDAVQQVSNSGPENFNSGTEIDAAALFNQPLFFTGNDGDALAGNGTATLYLNYFIWE